MFIFLGLAFESARRCFVGEVGLSATAFQDCCCCRCCCHPEKDINDLRTPWYGAGGADARISGSVRQHLETYA